MSTARRCARPFEIAAVIALALPLACSKSSSERLSSSDPPARAQPSGETLAARKTSRPTVPAVEGAAEALPAPTDSLVEVSGEALLGRVRASGFRAVIVNAWASWCGPCRREMPMLLGMQQNLEPRGVGVMLVSVDEPSSRAQALSFLREHGAKLPSYVATRPLGPFKLALNPNWPGMLPASFLFDAEGRLRYFWGGEVFERELLEVVDQFLAGTLEDGEARFGLIPGKVERE